MRRLEEGTTKIYNLFHDDVREFDIQVLRDLHVEMDEAVAKTYGWDDLKLEHGFHKTKQGVRFTISEPARREVLDRLLALNHERYAEEVAQGLHDKALAKANKAKKKRGTHKSSKSRTSKPQPALSQMGLDFSARSAASPSVRQPDTKSISLSVRQPDTSAIASVPDLSSEAQALLNVLNDIYILLGKSDLIARAGIPATAWTAAIRALIDAGLATRQGKGRGTRYARTTAGGNTAPNASDVSKR